MKIKETTCGCGKQADGIEISFYHDHCPMFAFPCCDACGDESDGKYYNSDERPNRFYLHLDEENLNRDVDFTSSRCDASKILNRIKMTWAMHDIIYYGHVWKGDEHEVELYSD